jgi:plastocyanin
MRRVRYPYAWLSRRPKSLLPRAGVPSVGFVLGFAAATALAATAHQIAQRGRMFSAAAIAIAAGDSIRFANEDEFLHQIYVDSPNLPFDSAEQRPGETIEVAFPSAGTFPVRCHIHPKMLLTVYVK